MSEDLVCMKNLFTFLDSYELQQNKMNANHGLVFRSQPVYTPGVTWLSNTQDCQYTCALRKTEKFRICK